MGPVVMMGRSFIENLVAETGRESVSHAFSGLQGAYRQRRQQAPAAVTAGAGAMGIVQTLPLRIKIFYKTQRQTDAQCDTLHRHADAAQWRQYIFQYRQ